MTLSRTAPALRAVALAFAMAASARAALWVSPAGDDGNPGTEEQPLRTIERARDLVRTQNRDMADDITVFLAGEYRVEHPIAFGPEDSGSNGFSIIYTAAPGEHPVLTGAIPVPEWRRVEGAGGLWSAPAPAGVDGDCDLYINGVPASRTASRLLAVFTKPAAPAPATAPAPQAQWKNPDDVVFRPPDREGIWSEKASGQPTFVENAFELLGRPGEWYFDRPARRLYYTPRKGENLRTADIEAAVAGTLVAGRGTRDKPITGLVFKDIRLEYTAAPGSAARATAPLPAEPAGAVGFAYAAGIQFLEDDFLHLGTPALVLGPGVDGGTVEGCLFGDISWSGIALVDSSGIRITESRLSYTAVDHLHEGAVGVLRSGDVAIDHDQFDHFPSTAVAVTSCKPGAVHRSSNWVTAPMIGFSGSSLRGPLAIPAQEIGISQAYRALEDEQFSALTTPRPPSEVSAEGEDEFAYVTWTPSCRDGGAPVESYVVESSAGAKATVTAAEFEGRGYVVMGDLEDGRPVSFSVSAVNAAGSSPPSLSTAAVTPRQKRKLRAPAAPAAVSVTPGTAGDTLQITPPSSDGGSPVVSYTVSAVPGGAPVVIEGIDVIHADAAHPVSRTVPGFLPRPGATISVAAVNTAGEGKPALLILK